MGGMGKMGPPHGPLFIHIELIVQYFQQTVTPVTHSKMDTFATMTSTTTSVTIQMSIQQVKSVPIVNFLDCNRSILGSWYIFGP